MTTNEVCSRCQGTGIVKGMGHVANGRCFRCDGTGAIAPKDAPVAAPEAPTFEGALPKGTAVTVDGRPAVVIRAHATPRYTIKFVGRAGTRFVDAKEVIA